MDSLISPLKSFTQRLPENDFSEPDDDLGIEIVRTGESVILLQQNYVSKLVDGMRFPESCREFYSTPFAVNNLIKVVLRIW